MKHLSWLKSTSVLIFGLTFVAPAAWADGTPQCNDSGFAGTECGTDSVAADNATAVGNAAMANGIGSVAVGQTATADGFVAIAIGQAAMAPADNSVAIGFLANSAGIGSIATGAGAQSIGENSIATGINANASGLGSVATGANTSASLAGNIAVGNGAQATGIQSLAVGENAMATNTHTVAVGSLATASKIGATAIGWQSTASGVSSTALGNTAVASGPQSTALGRNSTASAANSVALGFGSLADQANTVSVGTVGGERRIVNVAAGSAATDAVNFSQLTATNSAVTSEAATRASGDTALGSRIDNLSFSLEGQRREDRRDARAGTSAALAAAGLPQASDPGKSMIAGGFGYYRGRVGFAIGGSHRVADGSTVFKVGVTYDSSKTVGANGGVGFQF